MGRKVIVGGTVLLLSATIIASYLIVNAATVEKVDFDRDGTVDTWRFYRHGAKFKEIIERYPESSGKMLLYWNEDGSLSKMVSIYQDSKGVQRKGISRYKKGEPVLCNGETMLKQSMDTDQIREKNPQSKYGANVYVKDRSLRILEHNSLGMGVTSRVFFDEGHMSRVESYSNQYDGKINEINYYKYGKPVRHEKDTDGDGKMDQITDLTTNPPTAVKTK